MTLGSGLFSTSKPLLSHKVKPGSEIYDLRKDLVAELEPLAAIAVEEFTNLPGTATPGAAVLKVATATVASIVALTAADLLDAGEAMLVAWPRKLVFTTAGGTAADAPATVDIVGTDKDGAAQSETLALAQTATTATSVNAYKTITSLTYPAAQGTDATVAIGIAAGSVKDATATVATAVTVLGAALNQSVLALGPRQLVFTTAGGTPAHAPATVVITGTDVNGDAQSETLALAQTATTATSTKCYSSIDSLAYAAGDGTSATIAITVSAAVGLRKKIKTRGGLTVAIKEIAGGSATPTAGTFTAPASALPYGSYAPNTAFNDAVDQAIYYEFDATAA